MTEYPHTPPSAVALAYRDGDFAPKVVARGNGAVAEEIIRRAREAGVFVHHSADLVRLLMRVDLDTHIPQELYLVIAELLAWLYRVERRDAPILPGAGPSDRKRS